MIRLAQITDGQEQAHDGFSSLLWDGNSLGECGIRVRTVRDRVYHLASVVNGQQKKSYILGPEGPVHSRQLLPIFHSNLDSPKNIRQTLQARRGEAVAESGEAHLRAGGGLAIEIESLEVQLGPHFGGMNKINTAVRVVWRLDPVTEFGR